MKILHRCMVISLSVASLGFAEEESLKMIGEARLSFLFWPVYDSRLYTESGEFDEKQRPIKLEIEYLRNIKSSDLVNRTAAEWDHLGLNREDYEQWIQQLKKIWPDINKHDQLSIYVDKTEKSRFYFNGQLLAAIDDKLFGKNFLAIWLSPSTSQPEHRLALIGESE